MASPAVRMGMLQCLGMEQLPAAAQDFDDYGIGLEHRLAGDVRVCGAEAAFVVDRAKGFQAVFLPHGEVFLAVARSGVNDAAALLHRHVVAQNAHRLPLQKRMLKPHSLKLAARQDRQGSPRLEAAFLGYRLQQRTGHQKNF